MKTAGGDGRPEGPKNRNEGRKRGRVLVRSSEGSTVSSLAGFGAVPEPPERFSLFSAVRMASPDAINTA